MCASGMQVAVPTGSSQQGVVCGGAQGEQQRDVGPSRWQTFSVGIENRRVRFPGTRGLIEYSFVVIRYR